MFILLCWISGEDTGYPKTTHRHNDTYIRAGLDFSPSPPDAGKYTPKRLLRDYLFSRSWVIGVLSERERLTDAAPSPEKTEHR